MKTRHLLMSIMLASALYVGAADLQLPRPVTKGGMDLSEALVHRRSGRDFADKELPHKLLSSLLWSANGINRPDGHRTAPTGLNVQDIDIYVILKSGCYRYDATANTLVELKSGDFRAAAGKQPFVKDAAVNLFYVQDTTKSMKADDVTRARHGGLHAGAIMQNVYLFCAANRLSSVARDSIDRAVLSELFGLAPTQQIMLAQSVGYPKSINRITGESALAIACKQAGVVQGQASKVKCKFDADDDEYEVEFTCNGFEYEFDIDASTGAVTKSEKEAAD